MSNNKPLRILIVDDEEDLTDGLQRLFELRGYEIELANSGEQAIEAAKSFQPDGILMDLTMGGIDGVEAFRRIRNTCPDTFVVFMTGYSNRVDLAREEGALAVLIKPFSPAKLFELIENRPGAVT